MNQNNSARIKGKSILVVDDEEGILDVLSIILSDEGAIVTTALNGNQAVELLKKSTFDIMICDLTMPDGDGRSVLKFAKTLGDKKPKTLVCSGNLNFNPGEAEELLVDMVTEKVMSGDDLVELVNQLA